MVHAVCLQTASTTDKENLRSLGILERNQLMDDIVGLINKYGFPIVMAVGMGYIIKYVWEWSTKEIKPVISEANTVLIALIDRIRMLDNDLIRLNQKVNTVLHLRGKIIESDRVMEQVKVEREASQKFDEAVRRDDDVHNKVHAKNTPDDKEARTGSP